MGIGKVNEDDFASALHQYVKDSRHATPAQRQIIADAAMRERTSQPDLVRIDSEDRKHKAGDIISFEKGASFSGAVKRVLAGDSIGHIGWKSDDKAIYRIRGAKRGLDVPYGHKALQGLQFSAAGEKETILAGSYRVVKVGTVTEPGTNPDYGYRVKMYLLEEVNDNTKSEG